jgi:putative sterol carrier protein
MDLAAFTEKVKKVVSQGTNLSGTIKFVVDEGSVFVDTAQAPPLVNNVDQPADCTIKSSLDSIGKLMSGDLNVMTAMMMGKLKVSGDMGVAMKVAQVLGK